MGSLDRIGQNPGTMGGKACIRGTRLTVSAVVHQDGAGRTIKQILADYPCLEREDILPAIQYAAWRSED